MKGAIAMLFSLFALSCARPTHAASELPKPSQDLPPSSEPVKTATFAGGCFWCTEAVFENYPGVLDVVSGYSGGAKETANYEAVCNGNTGHAEAIQITYDPSRVTYGALLRVFFATHDPTTKNAQGPDHGTQYRSAVFVADENEKRVAEGYIKQLNDAKSFGDPVVTTVEPLAAFYAAEGYHQDFTRKNPDHPYIRRFALPKVEKVKKIVAEEASPTTAPAK